jgi:hypothetical protein
MRPPRVCESRAGGLLASVIASDPGELLGLSRGDARI